LKATTLFLRESSIGRCYESEKILELKKIRRV
jgi:hypothetical protein